MVHSSIYSREITHLLISSPELQDLKSVVTFLMLYGKGDNKKKGKKISIFGHGMALGDLVLVVMVPVRVLSAMGYCMVKQVACKLLTDRIWPG